MKKRIISLILCLLLLSSVVFAEAPSKAPTSTNCVVNENDHIMGPDFLKLLRVFDNIKANYPFEVSNQQLIEGAMNGMLQSLDPYSKFFTRKQAEEFFQSLNGEIVGIGIVFKMENGFMTVQKVMKDSPAEKGGVKAGDIITKVNGESIRDMNSDDVANNIKGKKGTKVKITYERANVEHEVELVRELIKINPMKSRVIDDKIGYIAFAEFGENTVKDVKKVLAEFKDKNLNRLIIDLRDNGGGYLDAAIKLSDMFLSEGFIAHIRTKKGIKETYSAKPNAERYNIVVLVNENTASASEVLAAALKENNAARLVGKTTFGKGIVQSMSQEFDGTMYKFTTSEWLTPSKNSINKKGIVPDYVVESPKSETDEDLQLKKAIELLETKK